MSNDDNIEFLHTVTYDPIPIERILTEAVNYLDPDAPALVVGYDEEGEIYLASSSGDSAENLWCLEMAKDLLKRNAS
jgi:hypothetical protein